MLHFCVVSPVIVKLLLLPGISRIGLSFHSQTYLNITFNLLFFGSGGGWVGEIR